jgi:hypothetical protein
MHHHRRRVPDALYRDVARFWRCSQEADESRCSSGCRFRIEKSIEAVCQS